MLRQFYIIILWARLGFCFVFLHERVAIKIKFRLNSLYGKFISDKDMKQWILPCSLCSNYFSHHHQSEILLQIDSDVMLC